MQKQLEIRLQELKTEYEAGQRMLADLEAQQANLSDTLLRINGAIQVLEEELTKASQSEATAINQKNKHEEEAMADVATDNTS